MKRLILAALVTCLVGSSAGCGLTNRWCCGQGHFGCRLAEHGPCRGGGLHGGLGDEGYAAGPPVGQVTYPYYTNRGPRDFLAENPQGIGP